MWCKKGMMHVQREEKGKPQKEERKRNRYIKIRCFLSHQTRPSDQDHQHSFLRKRKMKAMYSRSICPWMPSVGGRKELQNPYSIFWSQPERESICNCCCIIIISFTLIWWWWWWYAVSLVLLQQQRFVQQITPVGGTHRLVAVLEGRKWSCLVKVYSFFWLDSTLDLLTFSSYLSSFLMFFLLVESYDLTVNGVW